MHVMPSRDANQMNALNAPTSLEGLRIGLLTASVSRLGGGVFECVVAQAAMIRDCGAEPLVFGLSDRHSEDDRSRFAPGSVQHVAVAGPAQIGFSPGLLDRLLAADLDLLHLHGIWMYPSRAGMQWARRTGRPYVISPHGMLDPWITGRGKAKKALARLGYERASWRAAAAFHALTEREASDIRRETGHTGCAIIPNAGPPPAAMPQALKPARFVYLGRIHPKKNLDALVAAWKLRHRELEALGATLTIAGWGEDAHVAQLQAALADAPGSVSFVGSVFGEAKNALLADARFIVLPSHSEGLPMVILEAWAAGTPALMSAECNLAEGFAAGAALECAYTPEALAPLLVRTANIGEGEWLAMSSAALSLAAGPFSQPRVTESWAETYRNLIGPANARRTG